MSSRNFMKLLQARQDAGYFVCLGLDSDINNKKFPLHILMGNADTSQVRFNRGIIEKTGDLVACIKINWAFYLERGVEGVEALQETIRIARQQFPYVPVIIDMKCGDIGNTNAGYVRFAFERLGADGVTVPPYMGRVSLTPFLEKAEKGIFVLVRTSNEGAGESQDMPVQTDWAPDGTVPLYQYVAFHVTKDWNDAGNCGVVVGATAPNELAKVRQIVGPDMQILIPGVGAQGGELEKSVVAASQGGSRRFVFNLSRSVIFASSGDNFAEAARAEVGRVNKAIVSALA